jgi:hypothetical protein
MTNIGSFGNEMNANSHMDGIVADGLHRIRSSAEFQEREREIGKRISQEYAGDLAAARGWRKLLLRYGMEKKIQKELELIAPRGALYLHQKILSEQSSPPNHRPCKRWPVTADVRFRKELDW